MAHRPSPFGVPQGSQGRFDHTDEYADRPEGADRDGPTAPTVRFTPEQTPMPSAESFRSPEEEMEAHLERIHASRPLRRAAQRARSRKRWWLIALSVVSGLAVVAACTAGAYIVLNEGEENPTAQPGSDDSEPSEDADSEADEAPEVVDPIESRETDSEPLSVAELFGSTTFTPAGADGSYEVLETEELADCSEAGLEDLADLLADSGCTQVVRATMVDSGGEFAATAGVVNLADATEAEELREAVESGGNFAVLRTGGDASELGRAKTMVGYIAYGHYLLYVVIGRTDGEDLTAADDPVLTVVNDLVDVWLVDQLRPRRDVE